MHSLLRQAVQISAVISTAQIISSHLNKKLDIVVTLRATFAEIGKVEFWLVWQVKGVFYLFLKFPWMALICIISEVEDKSKIHERGLFWNYWSRWPLEFCITLGVCEICAQEVISHLLNIYKYISWVGKKNVLNLFCVSVSPLQVSTKPQVMIVLTDKYHIRTSKASPPCELWFWVWW